MSGRDVRALLEANGFIFTRQSGSHMILTRTIENENGTIMTISIPVPDHKEVAIGTLSGIIKRSGLPRELFEV
jgi:predicted RNA binding protein YcfA (HicA-like mRNA interferase family)